MFTDNSEQILQELQRKARLALSAVGEKAEGHAKDGCPVDTGRLKNSISYATIDKVGGGDSPKAPVKEGEVVIGTNVDYAVYVEHGTGIYADTGLGRKTPWMYKDDKGVWHKTKGQKPTHFLEHAGTRYASEYKALMTKIMKS